MDEGIGYIIYTLEFCPHCEVLKDYLDRAGISYHILDLSTAEALTELRMNGVFVQEAPVLQIGKTFLTSSDLFVGETLCEDLITQHLLE
ncbi:MAG: glutaredoxin family protein [Methanomicrobiales archaeon]|jgi:glutaredoxin|nr:glutaredoxin family protein [Methanomicrobiales archaeon]